MTHVPAGSRGLSLPSVLHVPNGTPPSFAIANDTFDPDPTDPAFQIVANDAGTADIQGTEGLNVKAPSRRIQIAGGSFAVNITNAAPADADLGNGGFGLWLDATPGATKLMVKAKDSGGTVRTAAIALS